CLSPQRTCRPQKPTRLLSKAIPVAIRTASVTLARNFQRASKFLSKIREFRRQRPSPTIVLAVRKWHFLQTRFQYVQHQWGIYPKKFALLSFLHEIDTCNTQGNSREEKPRPTRSFRFHRPRASAHRFQQSRRRAAQRRQK